MNAADGLLKSPLKLIGAKTGIKKDSPRSRVYALIPPDTNAFIEPFLGSGSVLIGKPAHNLEIVGDMNPWPIHFFKTLQSSPNELFEMVQVMCEHMTSEERFNKVRFEAPDRDTQPLTAAAWYYVINKFARNGIVRFRKSDGKCNSTFCKELKGRGLMDRDWLERVTRRIEHVTFSCESYTKALSRVHHNPAWFVFLDPPYSRVFTSYNGGDRFSDLNHEEMALTLKEAGYRFLLTINDNEFVRELYGGWAHIKDNPVHWQCSNTVKGRGIRNELIITNYKVKACT